MHACVEPDHLLCPYKGRLPNSTPLPPRITPGLPGLVSHPLELSLVCNFQILTHKSTFCVFLLCVCEGSSCFATSLVPRAYFEDNFLHLCHSAGVSSDLRCLCSERQLHLQIPCVSKAGCSGPWYFPTLCGRSTRVLFRSMWSCRVPLPGLAVHHGALLGGRGHSSRPPPGARGGLSQQCCVWGRAQPG